MPLRSIGGLAEVEEAGLLCYASHRRTLLPRSKYAAKAASLATPSGVSVNWELIMNQSIIELKPESIFISHQRYEDEDEYAVVINGELLRTAKFVFHEISLHLTFRDSDGRVILKEESYVDETFEEEDRLEFSCTQPVPGKIFKKIKSIDVVAVGEIRQRSNRLKLSMDEAEAIPGCRH